MASIDNKIRVGLKILIDGLPMSIIAHEFINPGKGQAFNRLKLRNLKNSRVLERTLKSGEGFEIANVLETTANYSYFDGEFYVFTDVKSFEEYNISEVILGEVKKWLKEQQTFNFILFNNEVIKIIPPKFLDLEVIETDSSLKGDVIASGEKLAVLKTGTIIKVPLFIQTGEIIRVDTRNSKYVSRSKEQNAY